MKIQQIRFKNLNSLVGEWKIDLTHPAFVADGIFAITGATGAGKTTILDAICLALYGRTPRLNKVTKSINEIMSRQTGECFAEVTFETQSGRFRCHWSQHRSRKNSSGELQSPKHEIANADSDEIFESNIRGVAAQIETVTGMDFDRFTRSMLLAQGGFAAFLQAAPDDRAPILEQITGTEIYSQISIRVHERQREERDKLKLLQAETAGIIILEPEQEKEIGLVLELKQKEDTDLAVKSVSTGKAIAWLNTIDALKKEIINLSDESSKLYSDLEAFKPDQEKLSRALSAATLDGVYATLKTTRKQQADDLGAWKSEEETLPEFQSTDIELTESLKTADLFTLKVKEELKSSMPAIQKVRSLDQKLIAQKKAVSELEEGCRQDDLKIDLNKKSRLEEQEKRIKIYESLELVDSYLKEHEHDEWLISGLAGVEEQLSTLLAKQNEILQKEAVQVKTAKALDEATKLLEDCQKKSGFRKTEVNDASKLLQKARGALKQLMGDRLLREFRVEKENLLREMTFLSKIAELEEHRTKLEDGKPCPLCGAIEHPFAEGNVPAFNETEEKINSLTSLITQAENQEATIKNLEAAENLALKDLNEAEKLEFAAENDKKAIEKSLVEVIHNLEKIQSDFTERRQVVSSKLLPLGLTDIPETNISSIFETLKTRLAVWQDQVKKKSDIQKQIVDIDSELKRLDAIIEIQNISLADKRESLEVLKKELNFLSDERKTLYGDKNPDDEERRLNKAVSDAEGAEKQSRERHSAHQQKWNTVKANVESLKKRIDQRTPELKKLEDEFFNEIILVGFSNEQELLAAKLPVEHRTELTALGKALEERQTDLKARQSDRESRLATEMARKLTDKSLEELEPQFKEQEVSLRELREIIAGLKHKLNENVAAKERIKDKQATIEAQKIDCLRWENLHELIGSADGKKYRNFAQGLTFEIMIQHANRQLQKMSDRYLLVRDLAQPLDLNVIDNYQAGEIRSTKNLSGGESFIVSLSLALGLSNMASHKVRVDSLFLDEGFGTLDEEALEIALDTLSGLQQEGKIIGIISHVGALKERISTQVELISQSGGRSLIQGPGCARLS